MLLIQHKGHIILDGHDTGLGVAQKGEGTVVFTRQSTVAEYKEHKMPFVRYSLSHDSPASGAAGRDQFKTDVLTLVRGMAKNPDRWWEKGSHPAVKVELDGDGGSSTSALGAAVSHGAAALLWSTGSSS